MSEIARFKMRKCQSCGKPTTRFECCYEKGNPLFPQTDDYSLTDPCEVVLYPDHEQAVRAAVTERDAAWEARIEELASRCDELADDLVSRHPSSATANDYAERDRGKARVLRSLLSVDPNTEKEAEG